MDSASTHLAVPLCSRAHALVPPSTGNILEDSWRCGARFGSTVDLRMWGQDCEHGTRLDASCICQSSALWLDATRLRHARTRIEQFWLGLRDLRWHWLRNVPRLAEEGLYEHLLQSFTCLLGISTLKFR